MANKKRKRPYIPRDRKGGTATGGVSGHPYAIQDPAEAIRTLEGLGQIDATQDEAAAVLGVSYQTLLRFFERMPEAREAFERGKLIGNASLRRDLGALARTNATMGIFLAMNRLGMRDLRNVSHSGTIRHEHTIIGELLSEIDEESRRFERAKLIEAVPQEPAE